MNTLYNKEKKLETVLEKLITLSKSPKNYVESIEDIYEEKNQLQSEKNEIQAKYNELLSQYDTLKKKLDKIEENYSKKMKLQSQFNQDINELGEETTRWWRKLKNGKCKY